ncbi:MAG TPA: hypothetical protein VMS76_08715 [Planctomycetota bacterium]|nr:hypothetical protein [Planctomycetota bacterium]
MSEAEPLLVAQGDVVVTCARERPALWNEDPPSAGGLEERPEVRATVRFAGGVVEVPLSLVAAFAVVHEVYVTSGQAGLESFLRDNDMMQYTTTGTSGGPEVVYPEVVLQGDQLALYRLVKASVDRLEAIRAAALEHIEPLAIEEAFARLGASREEVEDEVRRYFARAGSGGRAGPTALAAPQNYYLETALADTRGLLKELKRCRALIGEAEAGDRIAREFRQDAAPVHDEGYPPLFIGPSGARHWSMRSYEPLLVLEEEAAEAHAHVQEYLALAAVEYPILWKVFDTENAGNAAALGTEMLEVLRDTHAANLDLEAELEKSGELVWHYAPVVYEAMKNAHVPMYSIAWTAAAEKIAETTGETRFSTQLAMASGLVTMGAAGVAALAGAAAAAPPLGVAIGLIIAIDRALNLYDALQEYWEYQRQSDAFNATLDPSLALAAEPSVLWTAINIGFSLLALLPGAGAGKAARAVP